jgi:serine/threonine protein kinase
MWFCASVRNSRATGSIENWVAAGWGSSTALCTRGCRPRKWRSRYSTPPAAAPAGCACSGGRPNSSAVCRIRTSLPDYRSDIYSLGATLHRLLTGSYPYPNRGDRELIHAHRSEPAPVPTRIRPDLPEAFDSVIAKAMAKDPDDRYQSCAELAAAARAALSGEVVAEVSRPVHTDSPPRATTSLCPEVPFPAPQRRKRSGRRCRNRCR